MGRKLAFLGFFIVLGTILIVAPARSDNSRERPSPTVELSEARNLEKFDLSAEEKAALKERRFFFRKTDLKSIYEIYEENLSDGVPNFITTDLVLHTSHLLYTYFMKALEYEVLSEDLSRLTEKMVKLTAEQSRNLEKSGIRKRARFNLAYFSVAKKILDPSWTVPAQVKSVVEEELALIDKGPEAGIRPSPLFDYELDYTTFLPRGHYDETAQLRRYFKVINWYGQTYFRLRPGKSSEAAARGREETTSALLMVKLLKNNREVSELWEDINLRLSNFVGSAEDFKLSDYIEIAEEVFGEGINVSELESPKKLDEFVDKALGRETASTLPLWAARRQISLDLAQGFCFLGKRYDFSSDVFQSLVYPEVGSGDQPRVIPSGLDVMATLGSTIAENILEENGEFDYENYGKQLKELKKDFAETDREQRKAQEKSLKAYWTEVLSVLVRDRVVSKRTTIGNEWDRKQLNTALGSWTEMKHDTVLYSKRSNAMARGIVKPSEGYVEPRPEVYGKIADLTDRLMELESLSQGLLGKLKDFRSLLLSLQEIAGRELSGMELTEEQVETVFAAGTDLREIASYPRYLKQKEEKDRTLPRMALTVDVHRDSQSGTVLQEALGNPLSVIALVKMDDQVSLVKGSTYSYYEFTVKNKDLMKDEAWVDLLNKPDGSTVADWFRPLFPE
ncbi:DUF3160 domain-containing protein [Candidatus Bipolaricaulota bacterium]|nr:DUF3160 domain-containing protein [Candidatus Bipolaricaulota bacterium]